MNPSREENLAALTSYYAQKMEQGRLDGPKGIIEFERTREIIHRHLPPLPATVADIGGGPGRYTVWLAELGYHVEHRDLIALHVDQVRTILRDRPELSVHTAVGDACELDLAAHSVDAVLLLGPLYHLPRREQRLLALKEAKRIVKPGGAIFVSAISRWAPRLDAVIGQKLYEHAPAMEQLPNIERHGWIPPLFPGAFTAYAHRPQQLRSEMRAAGWEVLSLVGIEGASYLLGDLGERVRDPQALAVLLQSARALEAVPEVLGMSSHFLATGIRPASGG
ncbi:class I SAM-dependent methyltransferase [Sulfobacillus harzensis]|uniref:Class I SAM-dependent methyltransferase n=1 Tax=Sulfobacillus harzensis TaxID=2729629 RepID=A0A7Y0Q387_9FIRM|nr:class I SAM-dependent methyltransferase [Sulfobacillus harzensis]NMP22711.1 class I SAM-dependent methyltransferase [Sulfobacillus harzensis]